MNNELARELADESVEIIENYYPNFLAECGYIDGPVARSIFYTVMIQAVEEDQMFPDTHAKELVIDNLGVRLGIACEDLLRDAKQRFNKK